LLDPDRALKLLEAFSNSVAISALRGDGVDELLNIVSNSIYGKYERINVRIPYKRGELISLFHEHGLIDRIEHNTNEIEIRGKLPMRFKGQFNAFEFDN
jgi:GTP-binding protein HflX